MFMNYQKKVFNHALRTLLYLLVVTPLSLLAQEESNDLQLPAGGRVVFMGDGLIERMNDHGYFEVLLHCNYPDNRLMVRNLGWSGDEIVFKLRRPDYGQIQKYLKEIKPDLIIASFGKNESFQKEEGLEKFSNDLEEFVTAIQEIKTRDSKMPDIVLVSPIAMEEQDRIKVDWKERNNWIAQYTNVLKEFSNQKGLRFIDVFAPTKQLYDQLEVPLTINGIHLNEKGYAILSEILASGLQLNFTNRSKGEAIRKTVIEKNKEFFYYWRPVNAEYIVGTRNEPYGVITFPPEIDQIEKLVERYDQQIWEQK